MSESNESRVFGFNRWTVLREADNSTRIDFELIDRPFASEQRWRPHFDRVIASQEMLCDAEQDRVISDRGVSFYITPGEVAAAERSLNGWTGPCAIARFLLSLIQKRHVIRSALPESATHDEIAMAMGQNAYNEALAALAAALVSHLEITEDADNWHSAQHYMSETITSLEDRFSHVHAVHREVIYPQIEKLFAVMHGYDFLRIMARKDALQKKHGAGDDIPVDSIVLAAQGRMLDVRNAARREGISWRDFTIELLAFSFWLLDEDRKRYPPGYQLAIEASLQKEPAMAREEPKKEE